MKKNELFAQKLDSQDWVLLNSKIENIIFSSESEANINYLNLGKTLETFQVSLAKANKIFKPVPDMYHILLDDYIEKSVSIGDVSDIKESFIMAENSDYDIFNFKTIGFYIKNFWNDESKDLAQLMKCFPDNKFAYFFYKLSENKYAQKLQKIILKDIRTNQILYIEREIFDEVLEKSKKYNFKWKVLNENFHTNIYNEQYYKTLDFSKKDMDKKFGIRFLSDSKLNMFNLINKKDLSDFEKDQFRKIIFHVHGGGFITMSSSSHQQYLIKFAKNTGASVFSIDYPKAPHFKYKEITQCIFKSYLFVYLLLKNVIKVDNFEIIFLGDSAGGTLLTSLTNWIIINNLPKPKCLILNYPGIIKST